MMLGQSEMDEYALNEKKLMSGSGGYSAMNQYARNQMRSVPYSAMNQYAAMEHRLMELGGRGMNGYYSVGLGEDVTTAENDPFWQEYGLPSLELGFMDKKSHSLLLLAGLGALGYFAWKKWM